MDMERTHTLQEENTKDIGEMENATAKVNSPLKMVAHTKVCIVLTSNMAMELTITMMDQCTLVSGIWTKKTGFGV